MHEHSGLLESQRVYIAVVEHQISDRSYGFFNPYAGRFGGQQIKVTYFLPGASTRSFGRAPAVFDNTPAAAVENQEWGFQR
jgi:hypothetical protein